MNCTRYGIVFHLTWVLLVLFHSLGSAAQPLITTRGSVDSSGSQGDWSSFDPSISADGQYVAFTSNTTNLVANDTNDTEDIFVRGPEEFPWILFLPSIIGKKR
ncbi:MAG: hypothetical protein KKE63_03925 [Proteobacteria bacterium]|nr:hypothetical protein [Pseudomonadota bacterium]